MVSGDLFQVWGRVRGRQLSAVGRIADRHIRRDRHTHPGGGANPNGGGVMSHRLRNRHGSSHDCNGQHAHRTRLALQGCDGCEQQNICKSHRISDELQWILLVPRDRDRWSAHGQNGLDRGTLSGSDDSASGINCARDGDDSRGNDHCVDHSHTGRLPNRDDRDFTNTDQYANTQRNSGLRRDHRPDHELHDRTTNLWSYSHLGGPDNGQ